MRGISYRAMSENWISIVDKLCDEKTPHDVLGVVLEHLKTTKIMAEKMAFRSDNLNYAIRELEQAVHHIKMGMKHIDPES